MTRMKEQQPERNRGKARHCLNNFQDSLFAEVLFPGSSYDTGIGDLVEAQAPSGNAFQFIFGIRTGKHVARYRTPAAVPEVALS